MFVVFKNRQDEVTDRKKALSLKRKDLKDLKAKISLQKSLKQNNSSGTGAALVTDAEIVDNSFEEMSPHAVESIGAMAR